MENYLELKINNLRFSEASFKIAQFFRFATIGVLNTIVDFVVLNILIAFFGSSKNSILYAFFKAMAFVAAVVNSYFFNKFWVFRASKSGLRSKTEGFLFATVSTVGFLINVSVFSVVLFFLTSTVYGMQHTQIVSNIAAFVGTLVVLMFNFVGYKFIVFKS